MEPKPQAQSRTAVPTRLRALRAGFRLISSAAPGLAARVGAQVMFRTTRRARAAWERALLAQGRRFEVLTPWGPLPAWSFGEGPVVLLVHGWNGRGSQLGAFVEPLVKSGHKVILFDAPGHGDASGTSSSLVHFADAVEAVIDAVRPVFGRVRAVIAHSMGGPATVVAMSRFAKRRPTETERALAELRLPAERFVFIAPPIDVRDFIAGFARLVDLGDESRALLGRHIERRFGVALADLAAPALARGLSGPLLVVHDAEDREVPLSRGRRLAEAWRGARLVVTEGLGHVRILGDAGVIERVSDFVRDRLELAA